jgi:hypothetical protein
MIPALAIVVKSIKSAVALAFNYNRLGLSYFRHFPSVEHGYYVVATIA